MAWARPSQNGTIQLVLYHGFDKILHVHICISNINISRINVIQWFNIVYGFYFRSDFFMFHDCIARVIIIFFLKNLFHEWNKIHIQPKKIEFSIFYIFFGFWICFFFHGHSAIHELTSQSILLLIFSQCKIEPVKILLLFNG